MAVTVDVARSERKRLEDKVHAAVKEFEELTGMVVTDLCMVRTESIGFAPTLYRVHASVSLGNSDPYGNP